MRGSRNFCQGRSRSVWQKKALTTFFFFFFFSPQLILQKSNGKFQRNIPFFKVPKGIQYFPGGSNFFQGGVQLLIPYRNPYNLWFSTLSPPLDPHFAGIWHHGRPWSTHVYANMMVKHGQFRFKKERNKFVTSWNWTQASQFLDFTLTHYNTKLFRYTNVFWISSLWSNSGWQRSYSILSCIHTAGGKPRNYHEIVLT